MGPTTLFFFTSFFQILTDHLLMLKFRPHVSSSWRQHVIVVTQAWVPHGIYIGPRAATVPYGRYWHTVSFDLRGQNATNPINASDLKIVFDPLVHIVHVRGIFQHCSPTSGVTIARNHPTGSSSVPPSFTKQRRSPYKGTFLYSLTTILLGLASEGYNLIFPTP